MNKTARVYLTPTLVPTLKATPLEQRTGYVLPCRSRQVVYERLEAACKRIDKLPYAPLS